MKTSPKLTRSLCRLLSTSTLLLASACLIRMSVAAQQISNFERERGQMMMKIVKDDIKEHYYDPKFRGKDLDKIFKDAEEKIKAASTNTQIFSTIAQAVMELDDSHTFFLPPMRGIKVEYGWQMQAVGDLCYVNAVKPGSDAEAKGLKVGDLVKTVDGFNPTRYNLWAINYLFRGLSPRTIQRVTVQSVGSEPRVLEITSKVKQGPKVLDLTNDTQFYGYLHDLQATDYLDRQRFKEIGDDLIIWKMPEFDLTEKELEGIMHRVKKFKSLILDLRGNPGGYVENLRHMVGYFHLEEVKICDIKSRKETKPMMSKKVGAFEGKFVILVDSESASAAEVFARTMQLAKQAPVIGDRTSGSVMMSRAYQRELGTDTVVVYGTSVTEADLIMADGQSLEHVGVTPDELVLPTPDDLAKGRDPVLSRAAAMLGFTLDPEQAGKFFPLEWPN